jgi:Leucine-rich repeat (LRR) protein
MKQLSFESIENGTITTHTLDESYVSQNTLDLSMSEISTITFPSNFSICHRLVLHSNRITGFPNSIFHSDMLTNLLELNLSRNKLKSIPIEIGLLINLQELYLDSNSIDRLPQSLGSCQSLEILDVSYNNLKTLPVEILELKKLRRIFVGFNSFNILESKPGKSIKLLSLKDLAFQSSATLLHESSTIKPIILPNHIYSDLRTPAPYQCSECKKPLWIPIKDYTLKNFNQVPCILESLYCSPVHLQDKFV